MLTPQALYNAAGVPALAVKAAGDGEREGGELDMASLTHPTTRLSLLAPDGRENLLSSLLFLFAIAEMLQLR